MINLNTLDPNQAAFGIIVLIFIYWVLYYLLTESYKPIIPKQDYLSLVLIHTLSAVSTLLIFMAFTLPYGL